MKFVTSLDRDRKVSHADAFIEFLSSFTRSGGRRLKSIPSSSTDLRLFLRRERVERHSFIVGFITGVIFTRPTPR